jgi:hypothetical protein
MSDFVVDFLDMMPDRVRVVPVALDEYGDYVASGSDFYVQCRIEGRNRMVRDLSGREIISTVQLYVGGTVDINTGEVDTTPALLTTDAHRYVLPARFIPSGELTAVNVERCADESGPSFEVVFI